MNKHEALQRYFGYGTFRDGQQEIIDSLLAGRDVLGIMPTGAGKSVCYQLPALLMQGITLVVSPLISLMQDQVSALVQAGIPAAYLNSSLTARQYALALQRAAAGQYRIIYVAPERLATEGFLQFALSADIAMVTVDEAHCVSQWGQDFRPSYLAIADFVARLPKRPLLSAFTATATKAVKEDILHLLALQSPHITVTGFDRKNLYFALRRPANKQAELLDILSERRDKSGIVYCATRKAVEEVCDALCRRGYAATRYHAGLDAAERGQNQEDFLYDRKTVMVATNAFGMGIDKSNVSFVVHYNMPKNLESYYQEAGRAGRDGTDADCILLYSPGDVRTAQFMIEHSREADGSMDTQTLQKILANERELLKQMTFYSTTNDCLRGFILKYFGEKADVYCGRCSNCDTEFQTMDITLTAQRILDCVAELESRRRSFGRGMLVNLLRGSDNERVRSLGLKTLDSYGTLRDTDAHTLGLVLDGLLADGALMVSDGEYPVVELTHLSAGYCDVAHTMRLPKPKQPKAAGKTAQRYDVDTLLFSRLRELRAVLAKRASVPAYVVFSDATLRGMCEKRPQTMDELLDVPGIGATKLERYGEAFLALLLEYYKTEKGEG